MNKGLHTYTIERCTLSHSKCWRISKCFLYSILF